MEFSVAFWNLQNLFDVNSGEIATDLEFIPEKGWTREVLDKKIENLSKPLKIMNNGNPPDLIGFCEIESEKLARDLCEKVRPDYFEVAKYIDGSDIRGIDTCLVYAKDVFDCVETKSFRINFRYPTRDIFLAKLRVRQNNAELLVLVNHWPSRRGKKDGFDQYDTEFSRCMVAENCGRIVDDLLKIPFAELKYLPYDILSDRRYVNLINDRWNKNVLLMGDFNDDPFDKSISKFLRAKNDREIYTELNEVLEILRNTDREKTDKQHYLEHTTPLYNCMWNLSDFSYYHWRNNSTNLFDQFMISRGLLLGIQKLKMNLENVRVFNEGLSIGDNLSNDYFVPKDPERYHPAQRGIPM
ncbi:MAG: hypothetical protein WCE92_08730, partial [Nitrososphaeraceae archaeon]